MPPQLIILFDLWGYRRSQWVSHYKKRFSPYFDVHFYDSTLLAGIDLAISTEKELHLAFVEDGIDRAVDWLLGKQLYKVC